MPTKSSSARTGAASTPRQLAVTTTPREYAQSQMRCAAPLALGHVREDEPSAGSQQPLELRQSARDVIARQQVEHEAVDDQVEALVRQRQLQRAALDHLDVAIQPGLLQAPARLGEHALGDLDAHRASAAIGAREPHELHARSGGDLEHVLAGANARQLEHAPARLGLRRARPALVHRRESRVDARHALRRVLGLEHQVAPVLDAWSASPPAMRRAPPPPRGGRSSRPTGRGARSRRCPPRAAP